MKITLIFSDKMMNCCYRNKRLGHEHPPKKITADLTYIDDEHFGTGDYYITSDEWFLDGAIPTVRLKNEQPHTHSYHIFFKYNKDVTKERLAQEVRNQLYRDCFTSMGQELPRYFEKFSSKDIAIKFNNYKLFKDIKI